ncbi:MAG: flagellar basal-body MS-ring/collar protein FliF, partial [Pseudomonadota bacterium]
QEPEYTTLYSGLESRDAAAVVTALTSAGIENDFDSGSGTIRVLSDQTHAARLQLATEGLPAAASGMESVGEQSSFGVSQFMETARYRHALESELSRTIKSLRAIRDARVHLAIPKQTAFIRDQQTPTASVLLQLYGGQALEDGQTEAIANLVAGSIPGMTAGDVTVADQFGRLLSTDSQAESEKLSARQLSIKKQIEQDYRMRIETMLAQVVGIGNVQAQVDVDLDFTMVEQTRESFDPNNTVVRSEQISEQERKSGDGLEAGIPGAIANTPPEAGGQVNAESANVADTLNTTRQSTRNFEVDRTISRTRSPSYNTRRITVAVLIDEAVFATPAPDQTVADGAEEAAAETEAEAEVDGETAVATPVTVSLSPEQLDEINRLVQNAVGFSAARGDTIEVAAVPFQSPDMMDEVEAPPFWEQPAIRELIKQGTGVLLALILGFGIVRPMLKSVVTPAAAAGMPNLLESPNAPLATVGGVLEGPDGQPAGALSYQDKVDAARNITGHDPARVAQVVRKWIETDGE